MLIVNFSKESKNPLLSASTRIIFGITASLGFSILFSKSFSNFSLPSLLPPKIILLFMLIFGYFFSGFFLMSIYSSHTFAGKNAVFNNVLKLLPLKRIERLIMRIAPGMIMIVIMNSLFIFILNEITSKFSVNLVAADLVLILGMIAGYGYVLLPFPNKAILKTIIFLAFIPVAYWLFQVALKSQSEKSFNLIVSTIWIIFCLPLSAYIYLFRVPYLNKSSNINSTNYQLLPKVIPMNLWFLVKIWRNRRTRVNIIQSVVIVCCAAIYISVKHVKISDPYAILMLTAILSTSVAAEVRGLMRRYLPPEIVLIRGVKGIISTEILSLLLVNFLIGLPLLFVLHSRVNNSAIFASFYLALQLFASLAGLIASTLFVPGNHELGSQFFTVFLAAGIVYEIPKIAKFGKYLPSQQIPYWLLCSILVGGVIYIIEVTRRKNYGRT